MQAAKTVIFAAGGEQPLGAAGLAVQLVAGEIRHRQAVQGDAQQVAAAVIMLLQCAPVRQL